MLNMWFEKNNAKKKAFKKKYGRKPTKEEIKLLRKNLIDVGLFQYDDGSMKSIKEQITVKNAGGKVNADI